jgi:hypothetical protein
MKKMKKITIKTTTVTTTTKVFVVPEDIKTVEDLQRYWNDLPEPVTALK